MNTKFVNIFSAERDLTAHIADKLGITQDVEADKGIRSIVNQIIRARSEYGRKAEQVRNAADRIATDMARVSREANAALLNSHYSINSLGVLQGQGPDMDRLCGELQILSDHLALIEDPWDCGEVGVGSLEGEGVKYDGRDGEIVNVNPDGTLDLGLYTEGEPELVEAVDGRKVRLS